MTRPKPPTDLDAEDAQLFREVVASLPADHFKATNIPMLATYCRAVRIERQASEKAGQGIRNLKAWHDAARLVMALSRTLRITSRKS